MEKSCENCKCCMVFEGKLYKNSPYCCGCKNYSNFKSKPQTNRQWLESLSDEELAGLLIENNPTCADTYDWKDRYTNPCDRKYKEIPNDGWCGGYKKEVFDSDYNKVINEIILWLQAEHKE